MLKRLVCLLSLAPALACAGPLVTPAELAAQSNDPRLRIVDIRDGKDDAGATPYAKGHIAGAVHAPYAQWRGPADNPGKLPDEAALTRLVQRLGIDRDTRAVVVYEGRDSTDFGAAARVYWTLKAIGVRRPAILNGGLKAWQAAGLPLTTEPAQVAPSNFVAKLDPGLVATRAEVERIVAERSAVLLDARPAAFFEGEKRHAAAKVPGTIVGAKNVDNAVWFKPGSAAVVDADEAARIAQRHGVDASRPTISFCNTGHWAATNWFVLSELLGGKDVKLYPESMVEWSRSGLAMDHVPSRLKWLWLELKLALGAE
ncbi:MAG: rhodanese-like domain-containing protein [Burkholderiaceae bacterium]